jgi:hypothetical protein
MGTGWNTLGSVSSNSTATPSVPALTANGRTAASPNSHPPAAGPANSLPTICPAITRPVGAVQVGLFDQPRYAGHRGSVAQG